MNDAPVLIVSTKVDLATDVVVQRLRAGGIHFHRLNTELPKTILFKGPWLTTRKQVAIAIGWYWIGSRQDAPEVSGTVDCAHQARQTKWTKESRHFAGSKRGQRSLVELLGVVRDG